MKTLVITLSLIFSSVTFSQVKYIEKGDPAPYSGYLFTPEKEKEVRKLKRNNETLRELGKLKDDKIELVEKRHNLIKDHNDYLTERVADYKQDQFWNKTVWFVGGVLATGLSVYLAGKAYGR